MILGNQVEWALHCMTVLGWMPQDVMVPAKLLAEFHEVPKEYLSKALQSLANAELVKTTLGPKGGYSLARSADKISMLEIVEAVEGKKNTFNCQEIRFNNPCMGKVKKAPTSVCSIAATMYEADHAWREVLRKRKLSDVISDVRKKVPTEDLKKSESWFLERL